MSEGTISADGAIPPPSAGSVGTVVSGEATARQRRFVLAVAVLVAGVSTVLLPFVSTPLPALPEVVPFYVAGVVITDLITAFLLFSQFRQDRSVALLVLASAYLFTGAIVIPHLLSFPDFSPSRGSLIGGPQSSAWLWHFWHVGFPAFCLLHGIVSLQKPRWRVPEEQAGAAVAIAAGVTMALVLLLAVLATAGMDALPLLHDGRRWQEPTFILGWTMAALTVAALAVLWVPSRPRSFLHLWLTVALIAFFFDFTPNLLALQRYSVGWYLGRSNGLIASTFLLLMFLWETNRLYQHLGRTTRELSGVNASLERQVERRTRHLEQANADARRALEHRDLLLSEVYHRVKNNLQTLDVLLALEERPLTDPRARAAFARARKRILAIGMVHQTLLESDELSDVPLQRFVPALCDELAVALGAEERRVAVSAESDELAVDLEVATSLGLVVNELLANAFQHAFPDGRPGCVTVRVTGRPDGRAELEVRDDGIGMGAAGTDESAGSRIVKALVAQLDGEIVKEGDAGTRVTVVFAPHGRDG